MLLCKYLRWRHYTRLITVVYSHKDREDCNHGLSAANITLQKSVHLPSAAVTTFFSQSASMLAFAASSAS